MSEYEIKNSFEEIVKNYEDKGLIKIMPLEESQKLEIEIYKSMEEFRRESDFKLKLSEQKAKEIYLTY